QREIVFTRDDLPTAHYEVPADASGYGCRWPVACSIPVMGQWRSGYYQVLLKTAEVNGSSARAEAYFVVRPERPGRDATILLQLATNTYNAYNNWGGTSLYGGPKGQGRRVSFQRPYAGFTPGD